MTSSRNINAIETQPLESKPLIETDYESIATSQHSLFNNVSEKKVANKSEQRLTVYQKMQTAAQLQADVNKLLEYVVRGQQDQAEKMATKNPQLLREKGDANDYSGKYFKNVTALQFAATWARDMRMATMILKYLPKEEAKLQIEEVESKGIGIDKLNFKTNERETIHQINFPHQKIEAVYERYLKEATESRQAKQTINIESIPFIGYHPVNISERVLYNHWVADIGNAQRWFPVHVAQEICAKRLFNAETNFNEINLKRSLNIKLISPLTLYADNRNFFDETKWFPIEPNLGNQFAFRTLDNKPGVFAISGEAPSINDAKRELAALKKLFATRNRQYEEMKKFLNDPALFDEVHVTPNQSRCLIM